jgi:transcriptional regulator with XRE-family HTH domain
VTTGGPTPPPSLAAKLDHLFRVVRPPGQDREYTYREVVAGIAARGGPPTSENYVYLLRAGRRDNPGKKLLEALAAFFGADPTYFYETEAPPDDDEMRLRAAVRDSAVRQLALRSADLSPENLKAIIAIIEQVRELEKLPSEARPSVKEWSGALDEDDETDR